MITRADLAFLLYQFSVETRKERYCGMLTHLIYGRIALSLHKKLINRWDMQDEADAAASLKQEYLARPPPPSAQVKQFVTRPHP